ncbi:hypothetical protein ACNI3Q_10480 [Sphingomonas sp. FW199]|uniref:hypothetical protein n=1 Tax=Sphingomonas sp. FW199 TaxID=3400217 RepID=UPI003CECBB4A
MSWSGPGFVIAIIAISTIGWIINSWIRAKHGYPVENEWGGTTARGYDGLEEDYPNAVRKIALLTSENEKLNGKVSRLEERIAVLERIATDPAQRIAREIDSLR